MREIYKGYLGIQIIVTTRRARWRVPTLGPRSISSSVAVTECLIGQRFADLLAGQKSKGCGIGSRSMKEFGETGGMGFRLYSTIRVRKKVSMGL